MLSFSVNGYDYNTFSCIDFNARTQNGRDWMSALYERAANGLIDTHGKVLSVDAYGYSAAQKSEAHTAKTETPLLTEDELERGYKGIVPELAQTDSLRVDFNDCYATLSFEEQQVFSQKKVEFLDMREYIYLETSDSVDIVELLLSARSLNQSAIARIREIISEFSMGALIEELTADAGLFFSWLSSVRDNPICAE